MFYSFIWLSYTNLTTIFSLISTSKSFLSKYCQSGQNLLTTIDQHISIKTNIFENKYSYFTQFILQK